MAMTMLSSPTPWLCGQGLAAWQQRLPPPPPLLGTLPVPLLPAWRIHASSHRSSSCTNSCGASAVAVQGTTAATVSRLMFRLRRQSGPTPLTSGATFCCCTAPSHCTAWWAEVSAPVCRGGRGSPAPCAQHTIAATSALRSSGCLPASRCPSSATMRAAGVRSPRSACRGSGLL